MGRQALAKSARRILKSMKTRPCVLVQLISATFLKEVAVKNVLKTAKAAQMASRVTSVKLVASLGRLNVSRAQRQGITSVEITVLGVLSSVPIATS